MRFSFTFIFIVTLISLIIWMNIVIVQPVVTKADHFFNHPDYIVENLSGIQMNHESEVKRFFSAKEMHHFEDDRITWLFDPSFTSTEPNKPFMRVKARRAELLENGEDIHLTDNVTILRGKDEDEDKITMKTDYLHLIPRDEIAKTDQIVAITTKNTTMDAVGLELNNHTGVLKLRSRVKVIEN